MGARAREMGRLHGRIMREPDLGEQARLMDVFEDQFGFEPNIAGRETWPNMEFAGMNPQEIRRTRKRRKAERRYGGGTSPWRN